MRRDMAKKKRRKNSEFKPDAPKFTLLKTLYLTQVQRNRLLKWSGYILVIILALVIQDVIMSQVSIFGATTDLAVCVILLITVIEGTEVGSIFVLAASTLYYYSGTAPFPYVVGLLTFLGVGATLLRQLYLHRSRGSVVFCAGAALMLYEMGLYLVGLFLELTRWDRLGTFLLTGVLSCLVLMPLYPLINKIGLIGGNRWKE